MATSCSVCGVSYPDDWSVNAEAEAPVHEPGCPWGNTPGTMVIHRLGELCSICRSAWMTVIVDGQESCGYCADEACPNGRLAR